MLGVISYDSVYLHWKSLAVTWVVWIHDFYPAETLFISLCLRKKWWKAARELAALVFHNLTNGIKSKLET